MDSHRLDGRAALRRMDSQWLKPVRDLTLPYGTLRFIGVPPPGDPALQAGFPVTKKEIVKQISDKLKLPQIKTKEIVQLTFDSIVETLVREGRIELRNFGVFEVKRRKPRKARNPRTGESVQVEGKNVVTFQPGKIMEDQVKSALKVVEPKRKTRKNAKVGATASTNGSMNGTSNGTTSSAMEPAEMAGDLPLKPR